MVPHDGHIGPGGWRSAPQPPQRWTRSSPAAVPAQKNSVSGETTGRMTPGGGRGGGPPLGRHRGRGPELEHAEVHGGHRLAGRGPRAPGGHEPALAERGALGAGDIKQPGGDGQLLAEPDRPQVDLIAVGRDDRGVPCLVEQRGHRPERVVVARASRAVPAWSRPGSSRAARCPGHSWPRGLGPGVAERLQPVADHRQVDRVAGGPRLAVAAGGDPVRGGPDRFRVIPAAAPVIAAPAAGQGRRSR